MHPSHCFRQILKNVHLSTTSVLFFFSVSRFGPIGHNLIGTSIGGIWNSGISFWGEKAGGEGGKQVSWGKKERGKMRFWNIGVMAWKRIPLFFSYFFGGAFIFLFSFRDLPLSLFSLPGFFSFSFSFSLHHVSHFFRFFFPLSLSFIYPSLYCPYLNSVPALCGLCTERERGNKWEMGEDEKGRGGGA